MAEHWLNGWTLVAAGLAALSAYGLVRPPTVPGTSGQGRLGRWWSRVLVVLRGRSDAAPLRRRLPVCALASTAVCAVAAGRAGTSATWGAWPVLVVGLVVVLGRLEPAATRRRQQVLVLQTPQALDLLAACLAAGLPVRRAVSVVADAFEGPVAEELTRVGSLTELGMPDARAWRTLVGHPQLGPAATDLVRSVESGTLLVEGLQRHADRAREVRQSTLQVNARRVGVRSILPLMTCFVPAFLLLGVVPSVVSALSQSLHF